ncbi:MAG: hypothetical protein JNL09_04855 [Anaerolineales bacterium]|nr:hypothetical protein [Anaerolineales bacterium]
MQKPKPLFWIGLSLLALTLISAQLYQALTYTIYLPVVVKIPTLTFTPSLTPTNTLTPSPTLSPVPCPANTPAPVTTFYTNNGIQGQAFRMKNNVVCGQRNQDLWFYFEAKNTTGQPYDVGGLGIIWCTNLPNQCTQASWGDFLWTAPYAGEVIGHEDHLNIANSGTYQARLAICWLSTRNECMQNPSSWHYLSDPITIVIQ